MKTLSLTLVRHGQTDWNIARRIQGHTDIALNANGLAQSAALAERLEQTHFDRVVCSDAQRAQQTVAPLAQRLDLAVELEPRLRERNYGVFEGSTRDEMKQRWPELAGQLGNGDADFCPPRGESVRQVSARAFAVLDGLQHWPSDGPRHVLLITHGGVLDCLYRGFMGLALRQGRPQPMLNAAINAVQWQPEKGYQLIEWADDKHLRDIGQTA